MKFRYLLSAVGIAAVISSQLSAQSNSTASLTKKPTKNAKAKSFYIDVHELGAGNVTAEAVAGAHKKDLAVEKQFGVDFIKYWVDEKKGLVYCLSTAPDSQAVVNTHAKAHGLLPARTYLVTEGQAAAIKNNGDLFFDVHEMGPGNVSAEAVAGAHKKDLATQYKYGVNFINYWVDEKEGMVFCLAQAKDSAAVINTHREAHGLLPTRIMKVKQGQ